jgi:hypothetical protein
MRTRYGLALCMLWSACAFSVDLGSMMSEDDQKDTGYSSLTSQEKKHLNEWISKHFILPPEIIGNTPLSLTINIQNGQELVLSDGTHWEVAPEDRKISDIWLTPFPLEIIPRDSKEYPFFILNLSSKEKVKAKQLSSEKTGDIIK